MERRKEALEAALGAPARLWGALKAKAPKKAQEAPPEPAKATIAPPPEPRASEALKIQIAGFERMKAEKEAAQLRKAEEAAERERLRPLLQELHQTLQRAKDDPEVNEILRATGVLSFGGPRSDLLDRIQWKSAHAQIERLDREREGSSPPQPVPQQIQPQPEAPRRKSGPAGPKF